MANTLRALAASCVCLWTVASGGGVDHNSAAAASAVSDYRDETDFHRVRRGAAAASTSTSTQVTVGPTGDYDTLIAALDAGESDVRILDGVHDVQGTIRIDRPNVVVSGESRDGTVLRKTGSASLLLVVETENVTISNLTLDAKTFDGVGGNEIWEAFGCVRSDRVVLTRTAVLGSSRMPAVYYAGGDDNLEAFHDGRMDEGNVAEDNVIVSDHGAAVTFQLQKNGRVERNAVSGGAISLVSNKDSVCVGNDVEDSGGAGIFVSVPAENNALRGNAVRRTEGSGIVVRKRNGETPSSYRAPGIVVEDNVIEDARFMGIELDQTAGAVVEGNTVRTPDFSAVYLLRADGPRVAGNRAEDFGQSAHRIPIHGWSDGQNSGVYGDYATTDAVVENNVVANAASEGARFGIKIAPWAENFGSSVVGNTIMGSFTYNPVDVPLDRNTAQDNTYTEDVETVVVDGGNESGEAAHSGPATVGPTGDYDTLVAALDAGESDIRILDGTHDIHGTVKIERPNVRIVGQSRDGTVLRKTGPASFVLVVDTENVTVANITLDARTFDSDANPIWEAFGCVNCNRTTLKGTAVRGSMHMFAVFFAGPGNQFDAGQPTIDAFDADRLDEGNVCEDNLIESDFPGDVLSFSLQKRGRVSGNIVKGGVISFFMNKNSTCEGNAVEDSNTAGIFVSVPAEDNVIEGNAVRRSTGSGIVVRRQIDHRDGPDGISGNVLTPTSYRAPGIVLKDNVVEDARFMGIEIDQTVGTVVRGNIVRTPDFHGLYFLRTDAPRVSGNAVEEIGQSAQRGTIHDWSDGQTSGIYGDYALAGATIEDNVVANAESAGARFGIKIAPWTENYGSRVVNNTVTGSFTYSAVDVPLGTNEASENVVAP